MADPRPVLDFLVDAARRGVPAALVVLTDVTGGSARGPGALMAADADGAWVGSFSGGCVEAAVVAEARDAMAAGAARTVRFGAGSPYLDIRLPCGGGIDLLFVPLPDKAAIGRARDLLMRRRAACLLLHPDGRIGAGAAAPTDATCWTAEAFRVRLEPVLKLVVAGHGAEPGALLRLARGHGADAHLLSPDPACVAEAHAVGYPADLLKTAGPSDHLRTDEYSAVVMLFHDHDWEDALLGQALAQDAFFIGAMGSARTHAERLARLAAAGVAPALLARITGPVGLIKATRDPATLALSILAQIVQVQTDRIPRAMPAGPVRPQEACYA